MKNLTVYVLDNSIILKAILEEEGHEKVKKLFLLKDTFQISILLPEIFRFEFFNILSKKMEKKDCLASYLSCIQKQVSIIPLEPDLIELTIDLMKKYQKISFYDASYHALAKAYHADFITADEKYYELTKKEGSIKLLKYLKI